MRQVLAVVALLIIAGSSSAAEISYVSLVDQYAGGDAVGAVTQLSGWTSATVTDAVETSARTLTMPQLRAAVMLHSDLAYALMVSQQRTAARQQLQHGSLLIRTLLSSDRGQSIHHFAVRWYAFTISLYTAQGLLDDAARFAREGLTTFPSAAELYLARGTIDEMEANMEEADLQRGLMLGQRSTGRAIRLLESAAGDFRHALSLDRGLAIAHLHQGWVQHLTRDSRAAGELEAALQATNTDDIRYLAHLFLGAVAERRKDLDGARREFEAARAFGPYQTAAVALGRIEMALGHTDRARAIAIKYAQRPTTMDDPWWDYRIGGFNVDALTWLRQEARRR